MHPGIIRRIHRVLIQPDGMIVQQLKQNKAGVMVNTVDLSRKFYDPMVGFREIAISGKLSNR